MVGVLGLADPNPNLPSLVVPDTGLDPGSPFQADPCFLLTGLPGVGGRGLSCDVVSMANQNESLSSLQF